MTLLNSKYLHYLLPPPPPPPDDFLIIQYGGKFIRKFSKGAAL